MKRTTLTIRGANEPKSVAEHLDYEKSNRVSKASASNLYHGAPHLRALPRNIRYWLIAHIRNSNVSV
jgi:hypothetical protein